MLDKAMLEEVALALEQTETSPDSLTLEEPLPDLSLLDDDEYEAAIAKITFTSGDGTERSVFDRQMDLSESLHRILQTADDWSFFRETHPKAAEIYDQQEKTNKALLDLLRGENKD